MKIQAVFLSYQPHLTVVCNSCFDDPDEAETLQYDKVVLYPSCAAGDFLISAVIDIYVFILYHIVFTLLHAPYALYVNIFFGKCGNLYYLVYIYLLNLC